MLIHVLSKQVNLYHFSLLLQFVVNYTYIAFLLKSKNAQWQYVPMSVSHWQSALGNRLHAFIINGTANIGLINKDDSGPLAEGNHPFSYIWGGVKCIIDPILHTGPSYLPCFLLLEPRFYLLSWIYLILIANLIL